MSRSRNRKRRPTFWALRPQERYLFRTVTSLTFSHSATSSGVSSRLLPPAVKTAPAQVEALPSRRRLAITDGRRFGRHGRFDCPPRTKKGRRYRGSAHGVDVPCEGANRATERVSNTESPRQINAETPAYLRHSDCVRNGSTAKHSRREHPQWSARSPVWLTGDRGLCFARHGPEGQPVRPETGGSRRLSRAPEREYRLLPAVAALQQVLTEQPDLTGQRDSAAEWAPQSSC
ncbi:hypothetical protein a10_01513 [Streptomyces acidiscabies]|nr:hypothetical protein a10_01513 [Streptomyces acidiscabies]